MQSIFKTHAKSLLWSCALIGWLALAPAAFAQLDQNCTVSILNRSARVDSSGAWRINNVPVNAGAVRARATCLDAGGVTQAGQTSFIALLPNQTTAFDADIVLGVVDPIPDSLALTASPPNLSGVGDTAQLTATTTFPDLTTADVTADVGTNYRVSNSAIATVSASGLVTAVSSGAVLISALNEGALGVLQLQVTSGSGVDSDGDGIPDDFELSNATNPGGTNLAALPGVQVIASSFTSGRAPTAAIDGTTTTAWVTADGDAVHLRSAPFIEIQFPADQEASAIGVLGNRVQTSGTTLFSESWAFLAGVFEAFDASGGSVFNSGDVTFSALQHDASLPVNLVGIRRVRFTPTADEGPSPGLSEFFVLSSPGGAGLDPGSAADGLLDFDNDGLTNLEEFNNGTNIFSADTDGDGIPDGLEATFGTDPLLADSDNDGLIDGDEVSPGADFDMDGLTNALDPDADEDGIPDGVEQRLGLDPLNKDTDLNGVPDGREDADGEGLVNEEEVLANTDPLLVDTDGDGADDFEEVALGADGFITNPLISDTDGDDMLDGYESGFGLNPTDPSDRDLDPDADSLTNFQESQLGTDPFSADTIAPTISEVDPVNGATAVPVTEAIVIRANEPLRPESIVSGVVTVTANGQSVAGSVSLSQDGLSVTFRPDEQFAPFTLYSVDVSNIRDLAGNLLAASFTSSFTSGDFVDVERPQILTSNVQGDPFPVNAAIRILFSERMDPGTLTTGNIEVLDLVANTPVAGMVQVDPNEMSMAFVPNLPFAVGRLHRVTLAITNITDIAGNPLLGSPFPFLATAFESDTQPPQFEFSGPANGDTGMPVNTIVLLQFDEPISRFGWSRGIEVTVGGVPVAGSVSALDGNCQLRFFSDTALPEGSAVQVELTTELTDLAGNLLNNPGSFSFTVGSIGDVDPPLVMEVAPDGGATDVPTNTVYRAYFSERINPVTVDENAFVTSNLGTLPSTFVRGSVTLGQDGASVTLTPENPLDPLTQYSIELPFGGLRDFAGNSLDINSGGGFQGVLTTAEGEDATSPAVTEVSPPDGTINAPVNSLVAVRFTEPIDPTSVTSNVVTLNAGGSAIAGSIEASSDRLTLTLTPSSDLTPSTTYTVAVSGVTDLVGNTTVPFTSSFTTSFDVSSDVTPPMILSSTPAAGATSIPVDAIAQVTFSEPIDPASVAADAIFLARADGIFGGGDKPLASSLQISGATVTITPLSSMLGNQLMRLTMAGGRIRDFAGNVALGQTSSFTTANVPDIDPPTVSAVTPGSGSFDISSFTPIHVVFSEPIDPSTLTGANIDVLDGTTMLLFFISRSVDNRQLTLTPYPVTGGKWPADTELTLVLFPGIIDFSENPLALFQSKFTTAPAGDGLRPRISQFRPAQPSVAPVNSQILLIADEELDPATIDGSVIVSDSGAAIAGVTTLSPDGRVIRFTPAAPLQSDSIVQIFARPTATDLAGNALSETEAMFTTEADPLVTPPRVLRVSPVGDIFGDGAPIPTNVLIEVEFSEPLDPSTVTSMTATLLNEDTGSGVPSTISLERGGRVVRIRPDTPLASSTFFAFMVTEGVRDLQGQAPTEGFSGFFSTSNQIDSLAPAVAVDPAEGSTGIGVNTSIVLTFDEPINPLTVSPQTVGLAGPGGDVVLCSFVFPTDNRSVTIIPHELLDTATLYTVNAVGVEDLAGSPTASVSVQFTTGAGLDF